MGSWRPGGQQCEGHRQRRSRGGWPSAHSSWFAPRVGAGKARAVHTWSSEGCSPSHLRSQKEVRARVSWGSLSPGESARAVRGLQGCWTDLLHCEDWGNLKGKTGKQSFESKVLPPNGVPEKAGRVGNVSSYARACHVGHENTTGPRAILIAQSSLREAQEPESQRPSF